MKSLKFISIIFTILSIVIPMFCFMQNEVQRINTLKKIRRNLLNNDNLQVNQSRYKYEVEWYEDMPIDHFSYGDSRKFRLRLFSDFLFNF